MLYETTYMHYVFHANYDVWYKASQYSKEIPFEGKRSQFRRSYKQARHWDVLRDNRLIVPLEDFTSFWDTHMCAM